MEFEVRRLTAGDAALFRELRFDALRSAPDAFSSTYEEEAGRSVEDFADTARLGQIFAVFVDDTPAGIASLRIMEKRKTRHRAEIWGMFVRENYRGTGAASALLDGVLAAATDLVRQVELNVVADNGAAVAFYRRHGFSETGRVPDAAKTDVGFVDEIMMMRQFDN
jgi:ribosomal protein S18 acetylase RimI-like enzyme